VTSNQFGDRTQCRLELRRVLYRFGRVHALEGCNWYARRLCMRRCECGRIGQKGPSRPGSNSSAAPELVDDVGADSAR
jgi:hypothetical protein